MGTNYTNNTNKNRDSFTLIELLVVLALVAILSVVVVMTLNPAELLKQARDSNRLSDISTINTALNLFSADVTSGFMGTSTVIYISIPDTTSTCANLGLPALPTSPTVWTYNCVTATSTRNINGTGWIPVNFQQISSNSPISQLPIDPINTTSSGNYYAYVTGGSWLLTAIPESQKQKTELSNNPHLSKYPGVVGMGNNLDLSPLYNPNGLIGYWKFDEGSGTVAVDSSGNNNAGVSTGIEHSSAGSRRFYTFEPVGDKVAFTCNANNNFNLGTGDASWSIWFKTSQSAEMEVIAGAVNSQILKLDNSGYVRSYLKSDGAVLRNFSAIDNSYYNNSWHHAVITHDYDGLSKMYLDGVSLAQSGSSYGGSGLTSCSSNTFWIGVYASTGRYFEGAVDDFRVYNRAISDAEVKALYNAMR